MTRILILGATSAIAEATARLWAARGAEVFLVARDAAKLAAVADHLRVAGARRVETAVLDVDDAARHEKVVEAAWVHLGGGVDVALVAHGVLPDQAAAERDARVAEAAIRTNFVSTVGLLTLLANRMQAAEAGTLAVVTSVAGDRGRASNYVYGASKAGLDTFLAGLRHRLHASGVAVVTIKPGFVDTPMTAHLAKGLLWATPARVARGIDRAVRRRRAVAYVPGWWRGIMLVVRLLPEAVFVRTRL